MFLSTRVPSQSETRETAVPRRSVEAAGRHRGFFGQFAWFDMGVVEWSDRDDLGRREAP